MTTIQLGNTSNPVTSLRGRVIQPPAERPQPLPRHMLRRLCALDLVRGMLEALSKVVPGCPDATMRGRAVILCSRIAQHRDKALCLTIGGQQLDLSTKQGRRYHRAVQAMKASIIAAWDVELDVTALVSAVLAQVSQADEQLPRTPDYLPHRAEWGRLHCLLAELYETFDPNYADVQQIEYGAQVGERMVAI